MATEKRKSRRMPIAHDAVICGRDGSVLCGCTMRDVSKTGGRLKLATDRDLPAHFILILARGGKVRRECETIWRTGDELGVQFLS